MSYQDPNFDKAKYRKRRKQGLPGTEDLRTPPRVAKWTKEDHKAGKCEKDQIGRERIPRTPMVMTPKGVKAYPRRISRRKVKDRTFTSKGYGFGRKIGSFEDNIVHHIARRNKRDKVSHESREIIEPEKDPSKTNHQRALTRKETRNARRQINGTGRKPASPVSS